MSIYGSRAGVFRQGIPRGALVGRSRLISSVDASTNRFELEGHGLEDGMAVQFVLEDGGVLPSPISAATVYYALPVDDSDSLFQVSASDGGAAVDLSSVGTAPFSLSIAIGPALDVLLEVYSRWFDGKAVGHLVPFEAPYPVQATHVVEIRTAAHLARMLGLGAQADRIFEAETILLRDIEALVKGVPLRDAAATASANLATGRSPSQSVGRWGSFDPRAVP